MKIEHSSKKTSYLWQPDHITVRLVIIIRKNAERNNINLIAMTKNHIENANGNSGAVQTNVAYH